MAGLRKAPAFASDDWMFEQQLRAEMEAEAWRRLRELSAPPPAPELPPAPAPDAIDRAGSIILKGLVRFTLGAFGAYLAWIAAMDGGVGEFEIWLATGAGFIVTLALTMFEPARRVVHALAEVARWSLIVGAGLGALWLMLHMSV